MTPFTVYPIFGYRQQQKIILRQVACNWDSNQINSTAGAMTNTYSSLRTSIDNRNIPLLTCLNNSSAAVITYLEFAECVEISQKF